MNMQGFEQASDDAGSAGGSFLGKIPAILSHRRWWIIIPVVVGALASVAAIFLLPSSYRSTAVMLVQSPQLPGEVIGDGLPDNNISRRIARIREEITSRSDLLPLIEKFGLYPGQRGSVPLSKTVETMREAIQVIPTVSDTPGDQSRDNTVSFALSFDYSTAAGAQAVAQALMERVLELDARQSSTQASNAVEFLSDQASTLQAQIAQLEGQTGVITARNGRALAGAMPVTAGASGSYDVQISQLQRDNATLLAQRRTLQGEAGKNPAVAAAEAQLAAAKAIYADGHPDIGFAQQRLAQARAQAETQTAPKASALAEIDQLIAFNNSQMATLRAARAGESAQVAAAVSAQSRGPLAQQQLAQLQQKLAALNDQYKQVSERLLAARASARANDEQMGQRLSVVDPPIIPDTPYFPNRLLLGLLGVGGGLGLGLALALLVEIIARPLRTPDDVARIAGHAPLAVIPVIDRGAQKRDRWWKWVRARSPAKIRGT